MQQKTSTSLKELKQFLESISKSSQPDLYWQSILQSDIRNIIPKYEVTKIELVKNSLSQIRLIMENLNTFISLEVQKKHLKQEMVDLNQNISRELQQIQKQHKSSDNRHYDINLSARKKQLQVLAKQFTKSKTLQELKITLQSSNKWLQYIDKNVKQLQKVTEDQINEDIINFISTYEGLFNLGDTTQQANIYSPNPNTLESIVLMTGSYTKVYENKLREKILIQKLVDDIYSQFQQKQNNDPQNPLDQYWKAQVQKLRQIHHI